jgi:heme exporter protein A
MRLTAADLTCVRSGREVFAGLEFAVSGREALLVLGRNGAGKSSLLRMIAGLVRVAAGRLALEGGDPDLTLGEQTHYLGHQDAVKAALTVRENLQFWADYLGGTGNGAVVPDAALEAVALAPLADLPAAYLSPGQKRRLSLARLVAVKRPIWLLDEPTSALDAEAQDGLSGLMREHLAGGGIILAATHGPIGLQGARELRLGNTQEVPLDGPAPSPLIREGWGGGSVVVSEQAGYPLPCPSPTRGEGTQASHPSPSNTSEPPSRDKDRSA